jgi:predicted GIY-YIG superfamily endonuclease
MLISEQFLNDGASAANGYTRRQVELLGLAYPPPKGWRRSVIGQHIADDVADEFLQLAGSARKKPAAATNWAGAADPTDIYLYILSLEGGHFYVGLTSDLKRRFEQHSSGGGAQWTSLHKPIKLLHSINTGTRNTQQAEAMENEATVTLMETHGIDRVRGGHYSNIDSKAFEPLLRSRGEWERIRKAQLARIPVDTESSWSDALDEFLRLALAYYDADAPDDAADAAFASLYRLTRYNYWRESFDACLSWAFWNKKGVLPVLLSFKLKRPVSSRLPTPYDVLATALNRGQNGRRPHRRLFLLAWRAYQPPTSDKQAESVERYMRYLESGEEFDTKYDDFVSVLLPETRTLIR